MPLGERISRIFGFGNRATSPIGDANTAVNDIEINAPRPFLLAKTQFAAELERKRTAASGSEFLIGPGAERVRAAQAMIKRLARKQPPSGGIAASVPTRLAKLSSEEDGGKIVRAPALIDTPVQLKAAPLAASEVHPMLARQVQTVNEARRRRTELESLLEKLAKGKASLEDRIKLRHMAAEATRELRSNPDTARMLMILTSEDIKPKQKKTDEQPDEKKPEAREDDVK